MKKTQLKVVLPLSNVAIAFILSAFGSTEARVFLKANPPHDNVLSYVPPAQLILYCLNAPALVVSNLITRIPPWRTFWDERWLGAYWFHEIPVIFYPILFFIWWWIGWRIDAEKNTKNVNRTGVIVGNVLGFVLSLLCLYAGAYLLARVDTLRYAGGIAVPISASIWGVGIFYVCSFRTSSLTTRDPAGSG